MFPAPHFASTPFGSGFDTQIPQQFIIGGGGPGGGPGFPGGGGFEFPTGGLSQGIPAGSSGSGRTVGTGSVTSIPTSPLGIGTSMLSSLLGIPAINWGRIAAFLLGLLLIAGGLYLIKPVQQVVTKVTKATGTLAA